MRLLLDTHVALWAVMDEARLPRPAQQLIIDPGNDVRVSIVSVWEIAIKNSLRGRRNGIGLSVADALQLFENTRIELHGLEPRHLIAFEAMETRGGDPFDRAILTQAQVDGFTLLTRDEVIVALAPDAVMRV